MREIRGKETIPREVREIWTPPREITVPQWVEENVRLPILTSAEPGPLRISRTPYIKGVLSALGSSFIEWVVLVWGRQLGKSQGVQYPFLCYCIAEDPGPAICLLPTGDKAVYTSKKRLQPMFDSCEPVRQKRTSDEDDYTIMEMQFTDMSLSMAYGGSESQLTTRPARYLFRDEVDELQRSVGAHGVDPMSAIEQTTSNFPHRKIIDTSTPTVPGGNIWKELSKCQYVFEFWIPCPHCQSYQILYWNNVKFGDDMDPQVVESIAYYECGFCGGMITNLDKIRGLAKGVWRARLDKAESVCRSLIKGDKEVIENTIELEDMLRDRHIKKIGFHLPKWYSPFSGGTIGTIAKEYIEAKNTYDEGDDFLPMKNWRTYNAAIPWEERIEIQTDSGLAEFKTELPELVCPKGTIALTAGIDPGQGGFWFTIYAWKLDYSFHLVYYGFLPGDYETSGIDDMIGWMFKIDYGDEEGVEDKRLRLPLWRIGVDTGGSQYKESDTTMTEAAYLWIRKKRSKHIFGTRGIGRGSVHRVKEVRIDKMPGTKGALIPGGLTLVELNPDALKDMMWFHLGIKEGKPGRMTFHKETGNDFFRHLLAEEKQLHRNGRWEWTTIRKSNHWLDCTIIAIGMADSEFRGGIRLIRRLSTPTSPDDTINPPINPATQRPRGSWIKGWK